MTFPLSTFLLVFVSSCILLAPHPALELWDLMIIQPQLGQRQRTGFTKLCLEDKKRAQITTFALECYQAYPNISSVWWLGRPEETCPNATHTSWFLLQVQEPTGFTSINQDVQFTQPSNAVFSAQRMYWVQLKPSTEHKDANTYCPLQTQHRCQPQHLTQLFSNTELGTCKIEECVVSRRSAYRQHGEENQGKLSAARNDHIFCSPFLFFKTTQAQQHWPGSEAIPLHGARGLGLT